MGIEIERKFLINREIWNTLKKPAGEFYMQGYLSVDADKTIRVRLTDSKSFITIKGKLKGASRDEFEYEIPGDDARQMLQKLVSGSLQKVRYKINFQNKIWEIDEFCGDNEGLILAEIELAHEEESFGIPGWIAKEVTGEEKYYNANLAMNPYCNWKDEAINR